MTLIKLSYQPRLDGVRAVAVSFVLVEHFTDALGRLGLIGTLGVRIFFVLSGYLISRIILNYRAMPVMDAAKTFYWRRFLRLSPPLVLAISVTAALGIANMRQDWLWHILYLTNVKVFLDQAWGPATHFWSLSVEEQFYLVWFFALMLIGTRYIPLLIAAGIVGGFAFRLSALWLGHRWAIYLLPGAMDFFCAGALIAYMEKIKPRFVINENAALLASAAACILVLWLGNNAEPKREAIKDIANLAFCFLFIMAARDNRPLLRWLEHPIIRHIGRISYGIYVYHLFVPQILGGNVFVNVIVTLLAAELSWHVIELPIMTLKKRYGEISMARTAAASDTSGVAV